MFERKRSTKLVQAARLIASLAAVAWFGGPAQAALITTPLAGTHWAITYDSAQVSNIVIPDARNLSFTKTFVDLSPISITFTQTDTSSSNFGLRLTLNETVINASGSTWDEFEFRLGMGSATGHPMFPHFHNDNAACVILICPIGPFTAFFPREVLDLTGTSVVFATSAIGLRNGLLTSGASALFAGIGLHQFEVAGQNRIFTLTETPQAVPASVPEPATLALLLSSLGIFGLIGRRRLAA
jgi:PEP-CTERM motif-containing protein